jgi:hypothetical protein
VLIFSNRRLLMTPFSKIKGVLEGATKDVYRSAYSTQADVFVLAPVREKVGGRG